MVVFYFSVAMKNTSIYTQLGVLWGNKQSKELEIVVFQKCFLEIAQVNKTT